MGNSVKRNYIKRILRSALHKNIQLIPRNRNIEIIPKRGFEKKKFCQIEKDIIGILKKLEI